MSLIQVGTFLATGYLEEGKSMKDSPIPASNRTIMVVDDYPDLVEIVRITLESKGFNVRCAKIAKYHTRHILDETGHYGECAPFIVAEIEKK